MRYYSLDTSARHSTKWGDVFSPTKSRFIPPPPFTYCGLNKLSYFSMSGPGVSISDFEGVNNATNYPEDFSAIILPPDIFSNQSKTDIDVVFSYFETSDLYPLRNITFEDFAVASNAISATVLGNSEFSGSVFIVLSLHVEVSHNYKISF